MGSDKPGQLNALGQATYHLWVQQPGRSLPGVLSILWGGGFELISSCLQDKLLVNRAISPLLRLFFLHLLIQLRLNRLCPRANRSQPVGLISLPH